MNLHRTLIAAALLASLQLAACSREVGPEPAAESSTAAATAPAIAQLENLDAGTLRSRADASMQAHRFFAPAGDNALEYNLALRNQSPDDPGVHAALLDLEPELVIATEQSVARGAFPEARRLLGLLERVDAAAPALPRLRDTINAAETAARASAEAAIAEAEAAAEAKQAALRQQAETQATALSPPGTEKPPVAPVAPIASPARLPASPATPPASPAQAIAAVAAPKEQASPPTPVVVEPPPSRAPAPARTPHLVRDARPQYPISERGRALAGTVQVAFTIDASGEVQSPRVVASTLPRAFERAALQAAGQWKFEATGQEQASARTVSFAPVGG